MITVFSEQHLLRNVRTELYGGELVAPHECPERAQIVLERVRSIGLGEVLSPQGFGLAPVLRVHDEHYVEFLASAWKEWVAAGNRGEAIPDCWPARRMAQRRPESISGKLGFYAFAGETSIGEGSWEAARAAADVALTGAQRLSAGAPGAFALCRPPGHHAARDLYGGYCFLNNAAIAAQHLRDLGAARVAVLDVDFHHGNGTQDIFYDRADVLYASLHGDPADAFPYFSGYADEAGCGAGEGFTLNLPVAAFSGDDVFCELVHSRVIPLAREYRPQLILISAGYDAHADDPLADCLVTEGGYATMTTAMRRLAEELEVPVGVVLEGGYELGALARSVAATLHALSGDDR